MLSRKNKKAHYKIMDIIKEWGIKHVKTEYQTGGGYVDIYLPNKRLIIEVKKPKQLEKGVDEIGTGLHKDETAHQQLTRCIKAESRRERLFMDKDDKDISWIGIITDNTRYWIYEYPTDGSKETIFNEWENIILNNDNILEFQYLMNRRVGKEWVPKDPTEIFKNSLTMLRELYGTMKIKQDVQTQRELWCRQLQKTGNQPKPKEAYTDELFILHTLLIIVSVKISEIYGNKDVRYGFAEWVKNTDWFDNIDDIISRYNWKQETCDILRVLYMGLVSKSNRYICGEYYTPDWLAQMVVKEVIDDDFIELQIKSLYTETESPGGIMDPTCGSGTFLYYTIQRIVNSQHVMDAKMTKTEITNMVLNIIHGVDIQPIAVAMTKANIYRALPTSTTKPLHVYQGDSLQININEQNKLFEGTILTIKSRNDVEINLPISFVKLNDFNSHMYRFAEAVNDGAETLPYGIDNCIEDKYKPVLYKAFETLKLICKEECNDIWIYHIINQVGIYKMNNTISRFIGNPPWLRMSNIQDNKIKDDMSKLAKDLKIWVGGKQAAGFNIASLFVIKCKELYGMGAVNQGYVLPTAAIRGGNWKGYIDKIKLTGPPNIVDLGDLAFSGISNSCINYFGMSRQKPIKLVIKKSYGKPNHKDNWDRISQTLDKIPIKQYKKQKSEWFEGDKCIARSGANIIPHCLTLIDTYTAHGNYITGKTKLSTKGKWKGLSYTFESVPKTWIKPILFSNGGLLPYCIGKPKNIILPIDDNGNYIKNRNKVQWWKDASDYWKQHRSIVDKTPELLEDQLDYWGKITSQFPFNKHKVLYNASGSNIYASRLKQPYLVNYKIYYIQTKSEEEALFLCGILNADCLLERFRQTKRSDRDFLTHFWKEVPIPRYDKSNKEHVELAELVKHAEKVANKSSPKYKVIKQALQEDGVAGEIDKVVNNIIPNI